MHMVEQVLRQPVVVLYQDTCLQHRYIRSKDLSAIVERPERLRAVKVGLAAAIARLETADEVRVKSESQTTGKELGEEPDELTAAMDRLKLGRDSAPQPRKGVSPVAIIQSHALVDILNHPAVKFVHGDIDGDIYLENLTRWAKESYDKIYHGGSEIPDGLAQGDLYLCPDSINAIQGAVGAVCEAVDRVILSVGSETQTAAPAAQPISRAFVTIRPPGHHCGEDTPSGFCFINNVAVGAAHAHLQHGINRVVILDIDLHHGNGTQSIIWQFNEETYRQTLEVEEGAPPPTKPGLQVYYGSIHDILSFPCEDGKPELVQAASASVHNSHGQHIENIHLKTYSSEQHFWDVLYKEQYSKILRKAEEFLDVTGGSGEDVMVFISCGMDACEHEYPSMSRHNRKVPTSFYYRFTQDVCAFSNKYAQGKIVSVLEGGYSDRALISGAMAHLSGLVDDKLTTVKVQEEWWSVENLEKLEKATKKHRGGRQSLSATTSESVEPWLERTLEILSTFDVAPPPSRKTSAPVPPSMSMTLRDRKSKNKSESPAASPSRSTTYILSSAVKPKTECDEKSEHMSDASSPPMSASSSSGSSDSRITDVDAPKKLPRVILRLGPNPNVASSS